MSIRADRTSRWAALAMVGVAALAAGCSPNAREHYLAAQRVSIRAESPTVTPPSDGELAAQDRTAREP